MGRPDLLRQALLCEFGPLMLTALQRLSLTAHDAAVGSPFEYAAAYAGRLYAGWSPLLDFGDLAAWWPDAAGLVAAWAPVVAVAVAFAAAYDADDFPAVGRVRTGLRAALAAAVAEETRQRGD